MSIQSFILTEFSVGFRSVPKDVPQDVLRPVDSQGDDPPPQKSEIRICNPIFFAYPRPPSDIPPISPTRKFSPNFCAILREVVLLTGLTCRPFDGCLSPRVSSVEESGCSSLSRCPFLMDVPRPVVPVRLPSSHPLRWVVGSVRSDGWTSSVCPPLRRSPLRQVESQNPSVLSPLRIRPPSPLFSPFTPVLFVPMILLHYRETISKLSVRVGETIPILSPDFQCP